MKEKKKNGRDKLYFAYCFPVIVTKNMKQNKEGNEDNFEVKLQYQRPGTKRQEASLITKWQIEGNDCLLFLEMKCILTLHHTREVAILVRIILISA